MIKRWLIKTYGNIIVEAMFKHIIWYVSPHYEIIYNRLEYLIEKAKRKHDK